MIYSYQLSDQVRHKQFGICHIVVVFMAVPLGLLCVCC